MSTNHAESNFLVHQPHRCYAGQGFPPAGLIKWKVAPLEVQLLFELLEPSWGHGQKICKVLKIGAVASDSLLPVLAKNPR